MKKVTYRFSEQVSCFGDLISEDVIIAESEVDAMRILYDNYDLTGIAVSVIRIEDIGLFGKIRPAQQTGREYYGNF